ncbi:MAG TPA: H-type lectin domain-containing protein [bacterium]|nr:H-type lectin domain-containing protein [bacterium]
MEVDGGIYNVLLGGVNPLSPDIFSRPYVYLGVMVGTDQEMTPRQQITSVPSALTIAGDRIEKGTAFLAVNNANSGSAAVTFSTPFSSAPKITAGGLSSDIGGQAFVLTKIQDITGSGFTAVFRSLGGATATGSATFDWMAIGQ